MKVFSFLFCGSLFAASMAYGFGPEGHELVGAVAEARIAGSPAAVSIAKLLGGTSLARVATLPDEIKSWDKLGPNDAHGIGGLRNEALTAALWEFWKANPPPEQASQDTPSHHWFHYTDVPIEQDHYDDGQRGRSKWDIVHMIPFCVRVLTGKEPEQNPRKITKPVAVVLLAHYLGDLHQPLHVGSQYFAANGSPVDGDADPNSLEDQGGNTLTLQLPSSPSGETVNLHAFWDSLTVAEAVESTRKEIVADIEKNGARLYPPLTHAQVVHWLAQREPAGWKADAVSNVNEWTKRRADDSLLLARAAHRRLTFSNVRGAISRGHPVARGTAQESAAADGKTYSTWASEVLVTQIQKGGWRLAELLQSIWK